jgi:hypothetical protein
VLGVSPLYFGKEFLTSMWNDMLAREMVAEFRRERVEHPHVLFPDVSTEYIYALLLSKIKEARYNWSRQQPRLGETEEMAKFRAQQFDESSTKAKVSRSRKQAKWEKRFQAVKKMALLCAGRPDDVKIWQWVRKLLELLGALGMSSEDAAPQKMRVGGKTVMQTVHIIQVCAWRPEKVTQILDLWMSLQTTFR